MGYRRRHRRYLQRLRVAEASAVSASDMGAASTDGAEAGCKPCAQRRAWLMKLSALSATAMGIVAGAMFGGPFGLVALGGLGAAIDWSRK